MNHYEPADIESTDVEPRTRRALERVYTVLHTDGSPVEGDEEPTVVSVISGSSGREHTVDVRDGRCTCEDHKYRDAECAHIRRARIALGRVPIDTATLAAVDVHGRFAEHTPGPAVLTSDGGIIDAGDEGEVLEDGDDERPDDCTCWNAELELPCWPCYRDGFRSPNPRGTPGPTTNRQRRLTN